MWGVVVYGAGLQRSTAGAVARLDVQSGAKRGVWSSFLLLIWSHQVFVLDKQMIYVQVSAVICFPTNISRPRLELVELLFQDPLSAVRLPIFITHPEKIWTLWNKLNFIVILSSFHILVISKQELFLDQDFIWIKVGRDQNTLIAEVWKFPTGDSIKLEKYQIFSHQTGNPEIQIEINLEK